MLRYLGAQRAGVGHGQLQTVSVAVGQIELGALAGQPQRRGATDAAGRTGDKTPLSREVPPGCLLRHGRDDTGGNALPVTAAPERVQPQLLEHAHAALPIA